MSKQLTILHIYMRFQQPLHGQRHNETWVKIKPPPITKAYGRGELQLHTCIPLTLDRGKWSAPSANNFTVGNSPVHPE